MSELAARQAAIGGTRQMIGDDQFRMLVALLVDCGAIPRNVMAAALRGLAAGLVQKARGELATEWAVYPSEAFDRARDLDRLATQLETAAADRRNRAGADA
jgi:hypothetical protein